MLEGQGEKQPEAEGQVAQDPVQLHAFSAEVKAEAKMPWAEAEVQRLLHPDSNYAELRECIRLLDSCVSEDPNKLVPKVAAALVRPETGTIYAYRNEMGDGDHAEKILLRGKLKLEDGQKVPESILVTTLEPCNPAVRKSKSCCTYWSMEFDM